MLLALAALLPLVLASPATTGSELPRPQVAYLYGLSDFSGEIESSQAALAADSATGELYAIYGGLVRIFDANGMQTFRFGDDEALVNLHSLAVLASGEIRALIVSAGRWRILRCNFRGEPIGELSLRDVPAAVADGFVPGLIAVRQDRLYLASVSAMKVVVTDLDGRYLASHDLGALAGLTSEQVATNDINGFSVGPTGDLLFTIPTMFNAFRVTPAGEVSRFGMKGSRAGQFNIAGGIAQDEQGNVFVADQLRCVVMVFDSRLQFRGEFGHRGGRPENLVGPGNIVVVQGHVFVAQNAKRGVSVFRLVNPEVLSQVEKAPAPPGGNIPNDGGL